MYDEEPTHMNGLNDQEVPREDHQYEEINGNHGDDVVDLQHGMQNGHVDVAPQQMPQQVRLTVYHNARSRPLLLIQLYTHTYNFIDNPFQNFR